MDRDSRDMTAVKAGKLDRFADVVGRHQSAMFRYALSRLGSRSTAEDVVQEALMAAFRSRDSYDSQRPFRGWLWTILVNACRQAGRRRSNQRVALENETAETAPGREPPADEAAANQEQQERLNRVLAQLPEEQAEALRLRYFSGLGFAEISEAAGCSTSTIKSRVRYGLEKMAKLLQSEQEICQ